MSEAQERAEELAAKHRLVTGSAGNGYTEPREAWATCSCGADLYSWQEFYEECDDDVEDVYAAHIAYVTMGSHAAELAAAKAEALREAAKDWRSHLNQSDASYTCAEWWLNARADEIERTTDGR